MNTSVILYPRNGNLALHRQDLIDMADQNATLSIILFDRSSSMHRYGSIPQDAVNAHFISLLDPPDQRTQFCAVFSFASTPRVELPITIAQDIKPLTSYRAEGNTLQWKTVDECLKAFLHIYQTLPPEKQAKLAIAIAVFSDGQDNMSNYDKFNRPIYPAPYPAKLQETSRQALAQKWELFSYGIGIDAKQMAREMGFPDDFHAVTVEATIEGVKKATADFSHSTTIIGLKLANIEAIDADKKKASTMIIT